MTVPVGYEPATATDTTDPIAVLIDFPFSGTLADLQAIQTNNTTEVQYTTPNNEMALRKVGDDWYLDVDNQWGAGTSVTVEVTRSSSLLQDYAQPDGEALDPNALEAQLDLLVKVAQEQGYALGVLAKPTLVAIDLYVSPAGNDVTGDGTSANPWLTIGKALAYLSGFRLVQDTTINVAAGTYNLTERLLLDHPDGQYITIVGAGDTTIINATYIGEVFAIGDRGIWGTLKDFKVTFDSSSIANIAISLYDFSTIFTVDTVNVVGNGGYFVNMGRDARALELRSCNITDAAGGVKATDGGEVNHVYACIFELGTIGTPAGVGLDLDDSAKVKYVSNKTTFRYCLIGIRAGGNSEAVLQSGTPLTETDFDGNTSDTNGLAISTAGAITYASDFGRILEI